MFFVSLGTVNLSVAVVEIIQAFGFGWMKDGADGIQAGVVDGVGRKSCIKVSVVKRP